MSKIVQPAVIMLDSSCVLPHRRAISMQFPLAEFLIFHLQHDSSTDLQDPYTTAMYYL